jgi:hypothetical protein
MVKPINYAQIYLSLEDITVYAGYKVLMEINDNSVLIVGDPYGILDQ